VALRGDVILLLALNQLLLKRLSSSLFYHISPMSRRIGDYKTPKEYRRPLSWCDGIRVGATIASQRRPASEDR
jgi:hypothetical protein